MTKPSTLLVAALVQALLAPPLLAGDYHQGATLRCGDCHVMHAGAATASWGDDGSAVLQGAGEHGLRAGRLLREDRNDLCLTCHDQNGGATDVLSRNVGSSAVRQAGSLNRIGGEGYAQTGHTLGSTDVAPGSHPPWKPDPDGGLDCLDCHDHHGSPGAASAYRNLRSDAGHNKPGDGLVTYNERPGLNDLTRDVFVRRLHDYDESAVDFNEPDPRDSAMARFCAGCHGAFHGPPGGKAVGGARGAGPQAAFLRHPAGGVDIGARGGEGSSLPLFAQRANRVKVMSASGAWGPPAADATPTCITCHKAHGNDNPFGLIYRSGHGTLTEDGDAGGDRLEHLCGQCHVQAAAFALP